MSRRDERKMDSLVRAEKERGELNALVIERDCLHKALRKLEVERDDQAGRAEVYAQAMEAASVRADAAEAERDRVCLALQAAEVLLATHDKKWGKIWFDRKQLRAALREILFDRCGYQDVNQFMGHAAVVSGMGVLAAIRDAGIDPVSLAGEEPAI